MAYQLTISSTADLDYQYVREHNLPMVHFKFMIDEVVYHDDMGETITPKTFFEWLRQGKEATTSQVNAEEYKDFFKPLLDEGKDILHVELSSGITGSVASAHIARRELEEEYPDRKIYILDSLCASSGFGLLVAEMVERYEAGMEYDALIAWGEAHKLNVNHLVMSTDLSSYYRGGRISKTSHIVGSMLKICPIIHVNQEGKLIPSDKARGKKSAKKLIVEKMKQLAQDREAYSGKVFISHSDFEEDAKDVADLVREAFPNLSQPPSIYSIGTTIGSHTGIGTIALFFMGDER